MSFLKRLFGREDSRHASPATVPITVSGTIQSAANRKERSAGDQYFELMGQMQSAASRGNYQEAARIIRKTLPLVPAWVDENLREFGRFDIGSIPVFEQGGRILAFLKADEDLAEMLRVTSSKPQLLLWRETVEENRKDQGRFKAILDVVKNNPGCLQTEVKGLVGEEDGRHIAALIAFLERAGALVRLRSGKTYKLMPPGTHQEESTAEMPAVVPAAPKLPVPSHRKDRTARRPREIDLNKIAYCPLPRSPLRWDLAQVEKVPEASAPFEIRDANWVLASMVKIPREERPDPAFRRVYPTSTGTIVIDDLGNAEEILCDAAALVYDQMGQVRAKGPLKHGAYRVGVHPLGASLIALSAESDLYAYNSELALLFETGLAAAPEIVAIKERLGIPDERLKNHIRCVALSRDGSRYLFTAVDEAWCVSSSGEVLWGAKLPIKEGWTKVSSRAESTGTSEQVQGALELMGLVYPFSPEDVKRRYRELAKQWHPDLNPGDAGASEKMKALNAAAETVTGLDGASVASISGTAYWHELHKTEVQVSGMKFTMTVGMSVSESFAADWIYAAAFAGASDSVYLAGYSGHVVLVDKNGFGVRVYDVGAVPKRIIDIGPYLYILTDTRLYVIRDDKLYALLDTFDGGDLVVANNGFGLLEKKRFRWYGTGGNYLGSVVSKDPLRRVYWAEPAIVLETRQTRATVNV